MPARKAASAASAPVVPEPELTFDPAATYEITVNRVIKVGALVIRPIHGATVSGAFAETIKDAIVSHEVQGA